jgi:hypothetical protein
METIIVLALITAILVLLLLVAKRFGWKRDKKKAPATEIHCSIEQMRSIGELVVFKVITKEIVTAADHWFGDIGKKYFRWLVSTKKMAMIFEFDIDFRYDLRSPDFRIEESGTDSYRLVMPKCFYEIHIKDINFYDEQQAKLLPWLLPGLLNSAFGAGFDEADKNHLKEEAKQQASGMAKELVQKMRSEVQKSARQTLEALAKGFGANEVTLDFKDSELVQLKVDNSAETESAA